MFHAGDGAAAVAADAAEAGALACVVGAAAGGFLASLRRLQPQADQPFTKWLGQGRLAHDAVEHADRGDADLDGGEKTRGIFAQLDGCLCAAIALIDEFLQTRLARRNQGQLGHGKQAIEQDEGEQYCYFHDQGARCAPTV